MDMRIIRWIITRKYFRKKIDPYAKCISIEEKYVDDDHAQKESLQHSQN